MTSYVILTAVSPPLLLTGGEPFNATHLWSGWAFQQVHVSRQYKVGATILLLQVPFLVLVSAPLPYLLLRYFRFDPVSSVAQQSVAVQPMRRNVFAALTLIFYLVLPFILWSLTIKNGETQMISPVANPIEVSRMLVHVGYYDWFIQSITLAVMGAIVTLVLGLIGQSLVSQVRFSRATTFIGKRQGYFVIWFALICMPLLWFPMLWLSDSVQTVQTHWLLPLVYGFMGTPLLLLLLSGFPSKYRSIRSLFHIFGMTFCLHLMITLQEFTLGFVLTERTTWKTLDSGIVTNIWHPAFSSVSTSFAVLVLPTLFGLLIILLMRRSWANT